MNFNFNRYFGAIFLVCGGMVMANPSWMAKVFALVLLLIGYGQLVTISDFTKTTNQNKDFGQKVEGVVRE